MEWIYPKTALEANLYALGTSLVCFVLALLVEWGQARLERSAKRRLNHLYPGSTRRERERES